MNKKESIWYRNESNKTAKTCPNLGGRDRSAIVKSKRVKPPSYAYPYGRVQPQ
jgi:hypothetical protein